MTDLVLDLGMDHAGDLRGQHARGQAEVPSGVGGIDMGHQELVYDLVGMVMVDHQHLQAVR